MPRKTVSKEDMTEFRKILDERARARIDFLAANVPRYAEILGAFRAGLQKSGFSDEESMQIVLKVLEQPRRPMFWGWHGGHLRKSR